MLYTKAPEPAAGGGPPSSGPAPVYVEPQPDVFYRLAYAAEILVKGLEERGVVSADEGWFEWGPLGLAQMQLGLRNLAERFTLLGDCAVKELRGESLSEDERWALQSCLGTIECTVLRSKLYGEEQEMPPVPVVAAVSGSGANAVLEFAVGHLNCIFVVVPFEGHFEIAQGGIFSYYEFSQPRAERLTDEEWRLKLAVAPPPHSVWMQPYYPPGGKITDIVAFRKGDTYLITQAGANLNVRATPSTQANIIKKLQPGDYLTFLEGPVKAGKFTWWKVRIEPMSMDIGWVVGDPTWYERAYGQ